MPDLRSLTRRALQLSETVYPGYFALVMATGIVSTSFWFLGYRWISDALFCANVVAFPILVIAYLLRIVRYRAAFWADLTNPELIFTFFTFVAGSNVLGAQFLLRNHVAAALALWLVSIAAWLFLSYFSFALLIFVNGRSVFEIANASWFIAIVGTQSVVVLGTLLAGHFPVYSTFIFLCMYGLWSIGAVFYVIITTFVLFRMFFAALDPPTLLPPYWIILGATSISTLAGDDFVNLAPHLPFLNELRPVLVAVTFALWAWSSWWVPLLVIFGIWRHVIRRVPVRYHPTYWSLVFPIGMYSAASNRLVVFMGLGSFRLIPVIMGWAALAAWLITAFGLGKSIVRFSLSKSHG